MKAHNTTIKAIPRSIGQKKRACFAFFVPGPLPPAVSLTWGSSQTLAPDCLH
jgi:hypothetical protein